MSSTRWACLAGPPAGRRSWPGALRPTNRQQRLIGALNAFTDQPDPQLAIVDSGVLPVCQFTRAPRCRRFLGEAAYGYDRADAPALLRFPFTRTYLLARRPLPDQGNTQEWAGNRCCRRPHRRDARRGHWRPQLLGTAPARVPLPTWPAPPRALLSPENRIPRPISSCDLPDGATGSSPSSANW